MAEIAAALQRLMQEHFKFKAILELQSETLSQNKYIHTYIHKNKNPFIFSYNRGTEKCI
jgi:hypothetical protein